LLVCDGTLTNTLEAAFLEPITLIKIAVDVSPAAAAVEALELEAGAPVMTRQILLRGERSGRNFVYAETVLALDRLPPDFREQLLTSSAPLGRLWLDHKLETRKEMLDVHEQPAGELSQHFSGGPSALVLVRRYRVFSGGRPSMLITEHFPESYKSAAPGG
jgi:chorismate-pyruvate lyase